MIKTVEIINNRNEHTKMILSDPRPTGLFITKIEGLDAPQGTINMTESAQLNGRKKNGVKVNGRNIVLYLRYFEGNLNRDSIEAIRHQVYRMCPIGEDVEIIVTTDMRKVYFYGTVENNEVNIFDQYEGSQISILCEKPYGVGQYDFNDAFAGVRGGLTFPFEFDDTIEFGEVYVVTSKMIDYEGEARTGFTLTVNFKESVNGLTVSNMTTGQTMKISGIFANGDVLKVCTIQKQKKATLNGNSVLTDFFTNSTNDWVELLSGDNYITIRDGSGTDALVDSIATIESPLLYMGV